MIILRSLWDDSVIAFGSFGNHLRVILRPFRGHSGMIMRSFGGHFGIILGHLGIMWILTPTVTMTRRQLFHVATPLDHSTQGLNILFGNSSLRYSRSYIDRNIDT